ncbi:MAG: superoxide dismutase [Hyphomicrobiales bacterium]|nr:MAG: superoxide dismutase [Hyphomicrobiales bacterium]
MNRRHALKLALGATAFATTSGLVSRAVFAQTPPAGPFKLPPLGYAYEALEPHIDTATMNIHHKNHHQAYVNNLNGLVDKYADLGKRDIDDVLGNLSSVPEAVRTPVRNNLGGHWNHTFFWDLMTPGGPKAPQGELEAAIKGTFGDVDKMKAQMKAAALGRFGSGWAWLGVKDKKLTIFSTANQDSPQMEASRAVLGIDVWEHAYYLKYQSKRADYVDTWWNVVNWDKASANFKKASA